MRSPVTIRVPRGPVVTPNMRRLLIVVLVITALLVVNSVYLSAVTFVQWLTNRFIETGAYQVMFLFHLVIGIVLILPTLIFAGMHLWRAFSRPNRVAVRLGIGLFTSILVLFVTGVALTRGLPWFELKDELTRSWIYWLHVLAPIAVIWLFILHRLVGPKLRLRFGISVGAVSLGIGFLGVLILHIDLSLFEETADFSPSLSQTAHGGYIEPALLTTNEQCIKCHEDVHDSWNVSAHRFASFNNPAYAFSVKNTRDKVFARDGNMDASRFCASCHDPVLLFSGLFDDPSIDFEQHPLGQAGITCVGCHAIESVDGVRGNGEYTIGIPEQYPFAFSDNDFLLSVHDVLLKGRPALHKKAYLKPFHKTAEFCSTCHKVHLPQALNHYKWLRGQNHYDSFLISGVSGHGVASFYYPQQAATNCNGCHMPLLASSDFGSQYFDDSEQLKIHSHQFPAANTALQTLLDLDTATNEAHAELLRGSLRVDLFGIREGDDITQNRIAMLRPHIPVLEIGKTYVIEVVLRTLTLGHKFTEGTVDSNEVWLDVVATDGKGDVFARSGALDEERLAVDPFSHFVNAYVVDRDGNRINRRNAEDIFVKLYDNQIGPGSADVVFYKLHLPNDIDTDEIKLEATLKFRKFDQNYVSLFSNTPEKRNELPITDIASDEITLMVATSGGETEVPASEIESWERLNDYGIGMLLKPKRVGLRHAEAAFVKVASLGRAEGHLNLARVYVAEGRLSEAALALNKAYELGAYPWSVAWFSGLIDLQLGNFEEANVKFEQLVNTEFAEAAKRGFDFSRDYNLLNKLGQSHFEMAKLIRNSDAQMEVLSTSKHWFETALGEDPENTTAHYGLMQVYGRMGNEERAEFHRQQHETYRIDNNAKDRAVNLARQRDEAANKASEAIVVYDLHLQRFNTVDPST